MTLESVIAINFLVLVLLLDEPMDDDLLAIFPNELWILSLNLV